MALGKRPVEQQELWVATTELPKSPGHPFYRRLNALLAEAGFDAWIEELCGPHYSAGLGRPSIPPGVYFRMILVGYFEGISSQRGIAWRCSDSFSLREFLGLPLTEESPDHSSLTRVHQRLPQSVHEAVFAFVLRIAADKQLLSGKTVAVDSTTLEANAAMKSIVRKDTGEDWKAYLTRLMREAGVIDKDATPSDEDVRRFDKQRKNKKVSNQEWQSSTDAGSRIARMKDGRTHLAYKAEHVVDLKTDLLLAANIYAADRGDSETLAESLVEAQKHIIQADSSANIEEVATRAIMRRKRLTPSPTRWACGHIFPSQSGGIAVVGPTNHQHSSKRCWAIAVACGAAKEDDCNDDAASCANARSPTFAKPAERGDAGCTGCSRYPNATYCKLRRAIWG